MSLTKVSGVYILHLDDPTQYPHADNYGDSRHYVGCSTDIAARVAAHLRGEGSQYTKYALTEKIDFRLVAMFPGELMSMENMITQLGAAHLCPICLTDGSSKLASYRAKGLDKVAYRAKNKSAKHVPVVQEVNQIKPNKKKKGKTPPKRGCDPSGLSSVYTDYKSQAIYRRGYVRKGSSVTCQNYKCRVILVAGDPVWMGDGKWQACCSVCVDKIPHVSKRLP